MKNPKLFFLLLAFLIGCVSVQAQTRVFAGKVVEVLNGRTVVIDTDGRKLTAEVEFIEVPEPEQPLHKTVREHLEKLVLGKTVEFRPHGISSGKTIGQLYVNSVDVALQMLRDGAAWQIPADRSGQKESESSAYQYHQNQAKLEQRGVWGVKDMKTAWEFRAEKRNRYRQEQVASEYVANTGKDGDFANVVLDKPARRKSPWSDVNPSLMNPGPLMHGYNAEAKIGWLTTGLSGVKQIENMPSDRNVACSITYYYKQESEKVRKGTFVLTVVSEADNWRFLKANTASVIVDEKKVFAGKPKRTTAKQEDKSVETLRYEISKAAIEKIVYGGDVEVRVGDYSIFPGQAIQLLLYNMLQASN